MTEGSKTYKGLAVPLFGESVITGQTAATDILTIVGASSQSGDHLVIKDTNGDELLTVSAQGDLVLKKHDDHTSFSKLRLALLTTAPTSAAKLTTGDMWMMKVTTDVYAIALCVSGAASTYKRARRAIIDVTLGSAS
jgi:5-deoxy-D-glucuronate isomerase